MLSVLMHRWSHEQSDYRQGFGVVSGRYGLENARNRGEVSKAWWKCLHSDLWHLFAFNSLDNDWNFANRIQTDTSSIFRLYNYHKQHKYNRGGRHRWKIYHKITEWSIWRELFGRGGRILHPVALPERGCAYV